MTQRAGSTSRVYSVGVQFAVAAAQWIEENLDENFIAAHNFIIEPDATKDGFPIVRITAELSAIRAFSRLFGDTVDIPGSARRAGLVMSVPDDGPRNIISLKV